MFRSELFSQSRKVSGAGGFSFLPEWLLRKDLCDVDSNTRESFLISSEALRENHFFRDLSSSRNKQIALSSRGLLFNCATRARKTLHQRQSKSIRFFFVLKFHLHLLLHHISATSLIVWDFIVKLIDVMLWNLFLAKKLANKLDINKSRFSAASLAFPSCFRSQRGSFFTPFFPLFKQVWIWNEIFEVFSKAGMSTSTYHK